MIYQLPSLPYPFDALEPYIDARTMEIHYTKHHAGYVSKLNTALAACEALTNTNLETILADIRVVPDDHRQDVRNNGGGHLNHTLFWQIMGPASGSGEPNGPFRDALFSTFGDLASFKSEFSKEALNRFGSGWAWLCLNDQGKLEILSTPNQDHPVMYGLKPVLGLDVWEHAYYLKYQNRRADYVAAWWSIVNWSKVAEMYAHRIGTIARTTGR